MSIKLTYIKFASGNFIIKKEIVRIRSIISAHEYSFLVNLFFKGVSKLANYATKLVGVLFINVIFFLYCSKQEDNTHASRHKRYF